MEMLRQQGLSDVEMDAEGNVMGIRRGCRRRRADPCWSSTRTSTPSFPEGTDVKVKRQGTRLSAPGIGDDTRGLALILALVRTLDAAKFTTPADILFVGNVGEEGEGDLRGIKFLLKRASTRTASSRCWPSTATSRARSRAAASAASGIASRSKGPAATATAPSAS